MHAHATWTAKTASRDAGVELGEKISANVAHLKVVIVYATVHHELEKLLEGLASKLPAGTVVSGCSSHGLTLRNFFQEDGFLAGAIGLGDAGLVGASALEHEINVDTVEKAKRLAQQIRDQLGRSPKALVVYYDPLSRVDVPKLIAGLNAVLPDTLVVGGAAGQPWGPMVRTYQFDGTRVSTGACVALGLDGPFGVLCGRSSGAAPAGIRMKVTRSDGNHLLELDGRPALDVWLEMVGRETSTNNVDDSAAWAIGLRQKDSGTIDGEELWTIMAAFGFDPARKSVILQASVPEMSRSRVAVIACTLSTGPTSQSTRST